MNDASHSLDCLAAATGLLLAWLLGRGAVLRASGQADGPPVLPAWR